MRRVPPCVYDSRRALYRVFVSPAQGPALSTASPSLSRPQLSATLPAPGPHGNDALAAGQTRRFAAKPPARGPRGQTSVAAADQLAREGRGFDTRFTTQQDIARSGRDRPPQDHEITDPQIMVVDDGAPEGPLATSFVLTKLEAHESLRMVQPYVPADPKNNRPSAQLAVCKIVNKRDEYERQRQLREMKKAAAGKPKTKELELTWAIGEHDLATKMRQMGQFLDKGMKVELLVARKKGGRQVDAKEAEGVLRRIRHEVDRIGGREAKGASGVVGATYRLYLEGRQK
ncbi:translation initiation factor IF-3 [Metarhizium album ARSEF 1941]|uniref:Translation initiation factor IF-3 n=1 Tax=Metarhizium album (strain ARSEF 1941) TaxID=1081103 RepID=A0A0B2WLZ1_METAS|nr:translation initiation factor IF-3 [Metarhizium album ARSEF 1941]KHN94035.1 translation initiation factor IF-3 [Metarhizium album ARSEF 1941]